MSKPLEKDIEKEGCKIAFRRGWWESKLTSPSRRGFPDRIYIRHGMVLFVEWKKEGEKATEQQEIVHKLLRDAGAEVHVIDNLEYALKVFA